MASISGVLEGYQEESLESAHYWQVLGLSQSPFLPSNQYAMYYPIPAWQRVFDYLHQMSEKKHPLALVLGMLGSGKSTLISQFLAQLDRHVNILSLKADASMTISNLLTIITENFNWLIEDKSDLKYYMDSVLSIIEGGKRHYLLLVDDAHELPLETLAALIHLAGQQNTEKSLLSIMFFGEAPLQVRIEDLTEKNLTELPIDVLTIDPLSLEETQSYLKHRFIKAGSTRPLPFSVTDVVHIHRLSGGLPGRINRVAEQTLVDMLRGREFVASQPTRTVTIGESRFDYQGLRWFAGALFLVLLLSALWLVREPVSFGNYGGATRHAQAKPGFLTISHVESIGAPSAEQVNAIPAVAVKEESVQPTFASEVEVSATPSLIQSAPIKPIVSELVSAPHTETVTHKGYALQLIAVKNQKELDKFLAKNQLAGKTVHLKTQRDGQEWTLVLYGHYATMEQAKAAIDYLPAELKALSPWARSMQSVEKIQLKN